MEIMIGIKQHFFPARAESDQNLHAWRADMTFFFNSDLANDIFLCPISTADAKICI